MTPDERMLHVPEGLEGERVDAAIARLFGVSRTKAADLAAAGHVSLNHRSAVKSDRVSAGDLLEVALPRAEDSPRLAVIAEPVPGMTIVHDDDDIVVVDKPVGVAAHPSVGWTGPTVLGGLAAAGYRISTSGASERQGVVSRLDVGTSGLMVVCKSERAYSVLKRAFKHRTVDKTYDALVQGLPDPLVGTIDAPIGRHPGADYKFAVLDSGRNAVTHYEVVEAFGTPPCWRSISRPGVPTRSGALRRTAPSLLRRPHLRRRPQAGRTGSDSSGSGCTRPASGSNTHPARVGHLLQPVPRGPPACPRRDRD